MEQQTVEPTTPTLGPFLTLLLRIVNRRRAWPASLTVNSAVGRSRASASVRLVSDDMVGQQTRTAFSGAMTLGPFLTLILTLHRSGSASDCSRCQRTPSLHEGLSASCIASR